MTSALYFLDSLLPSRQIRDGEMKVLRDGAERGDGPPERCPRIPKGGRKVEETGAEAKTNRSRKGTAF